MYNWDNYQYWHCCAVCGEELDAEHTCNSNVLRSKQAAHTRHNNADWDTDNHGTGKPIREPQVIGKEYE
jgi:hypothetical protein